MTEQPTSYLALVEDIARIGYESQTDFKWATLPPKCPEWEMWRRTATRILIYVIGIADKVEARKSEKKIIV
jgi:hypothetical protein